MTTEWHQTRLGDVALVSTGPFGSLLHKSDYASRGVPLVNPINIQDAGIVPDPTKLINEATKRRLSSYMLEEGDVVVGRRGEIGRCAVIGHYEAGWICGTGSFFVRPSSSLDPHFLAHLLRSHRCRALLEAASTGATMSNLSNKVLADLVVALPAIREQNRIVAILDEAFAGIGEAIANTEKNLANARELFDSYLNSVFINQDAHSFTPISEVGDVFDGPHATPRAVDAGPIFLGISALQDGRIILERTRHVTPTDFQQWTRRVKPQARDVVFSYETRLGQAAIIPDGLECCLGRRMGLLRTNRDRLNPEFFVYQYISPPFRKFLHSRIVRGATVDRIALREFPAFPIYLPNLLEQQRIVSQIDLLRSEIDRLTSIYEQKRNGLVELKQAVLQKAFAGELATHPVKALQEAAE